MYARTKRSRGGDYLQIVESRRVDGQPRQRLVLYVGHYESVADALERIPRELRRMRYEATRLRSQCEAITRYGGLKNEELTRRAGNATDRAKSLAERLERLRELVKAHPELVEKAEKARPRKVQKKKGDVFRCPTCSGSGWVKGSSDFCRTCSGRGLVIVNEEYLELVEA